MTELAALRSTDSTETLPLPRIEVIIDDPAATALAPLITHTLVMPRALRDEVIDLVR